MNKVIFQIGLLAFCVSSVVFGIQGNNLLETVSRGFIVFIAVVCTIALLLFAVSMMAAKQQARNQGVSGEHGAEDQESAQEEHSAKNAA